MMSSTVTNGEVEGSEDATVSKPKKARKSISGTMVFRKKDGAFFKNAAKNKNKAAAKGKISMEKEVEQQIFSGQLKPYVPVINALPQAVSDESETFFTCIDCSDKFLFESSLKMHLSRRSVKISLWRPGLSEAKVFYNRCQLLASLREQIGPSSGLSARISIQPLDRELLIQSTSSSQDEEEVTNPESELQSTAHKAADVSKINGSNMSSTKTCNKEIPSKIPNNESNKLQKNQNNKNESISKESPNLNISTKEKSVPSDVDKTSSHSADMEELSEDEEGGTSVMSERCPECNIKLTPGTDLKQHFHGSLENKISNLKCSSCKIPLSTSCSLKAHERIHLSTSKANDKFVCPECGVLFASHNVFMHHLHKECFHAFYAECFKCQSCVSMFPTAISLEVHILKVHIKKVHKCSTCNIACYSIPALQKHRSEVHNEAHGRSVVYQLCQLCPGRLITQSHLLFHVHQHAEDPLSAHLRYVCEPCNVFVEEKDNFIEHKKRCEKMISKFIRPAICIEEEQPKDTFMKVNTTKVVKPIPVINQTSNNVSEIDKTSDKNISKMKKSQNNLSLSANRTCHKCGTTMQPYKYKMFACFNCNKRLNKTLKKCNTFKNLSPNVTVKSNLSDDTNGIASDVSEAGKNAVSQTNNNYTCPVCKISFTEEYDKIKEHFTTLHHDICKNINWCSATLNENLKDIEIVLTKTQNNDKKKDSKFTCNVCQLKADEEVEFRNHIVTHVPADSPGFQCMECGMCYVVKPSLAKHLLLTHNIRGIDEYLRESGQDLKDEHGINRQPVKENQCKVCYRQFECAQELNSHLRTHGLAFLLKKCRSA